MPTTSDLTRLVRPLRNGQITIPIEFRKALQLEAGVMLQMTLSGDELRIRPVKLAHIDTGTAWLHKLYEMYAPVRYQTQSHTEAEIDATVTALLTHIRSHHPTST